MTRSATSIPVRTIPQGRLMGTITIPPSKSVTHRLLILAAVARQPVRIINPLRSNDTLATLRALQQLGYRIEEEAEAFVFRGFRERNQPVSLQVGDSGTTARFITALAALHQPPITIDGSPRMRQRPMAELLQALRHLGAEIDDDNGHLPLTIRRSISRGGAVPLDVSRSSQYLSALLLIAPALREGLTIRLQTPLVSASYVDLTVGLLQQAGVSCVRRGEQFEIPGASQISLPLTLPVEGDYSSAGYFIAGAMLTGGEVRFKGLVKNSAQGDRRILSLVERIGGEVQWEGDILKVRGKNSFPGFQEDCVHCPDLVPTLAVLALFASTPSFLQNIAHLQYKESDRIQAVIENIERLGGKAYREGEHLVIVPQELHGATLPTYNDHRLAMSFALVGLRVPNVRIEHPETVAKSFPNFWEIFERTIRRDGE